MIASPKLSTLLKIVRLTIGPRCCQVSLTRAAVGSGASFNDETCNLLENRGISCGALRCIYGFPAQPNGHSLCAVNSIERCIGRLLTGRIFSDGFAQFFAGCGLVQQIVGDLKSESGFFAIQCEGIQFPRIG